MTSDTSYKIAETLVYNKDFFRQAMLPEYFKTKNMDKNEAILYIEDTLKYQLATNTTFSLFDIEDAFKDERVKLVIDKCFLREFHYEH